ncbi:MAG: V-type ATPase subunit [Clostridia bacterium]|nr:V-type ATPase subunit [Clostridia bacterium]
MKKYKDTDYLHVSVRLRAIAHKTAVDSDTLVKIVDSRSVDTAVKMLEEKGLILSSAVSEGTEGILKRLDKALTDELNKSYSLVTSIIGSSELVTLLKVRYDFQNLKALIKAERLGISPDSMLVDSGNISLKALKDGFRERDKKLLDGVIESVSEKAIKESSETGDPQKIDLIADKACFEYIMSRSKKSGFDFLSDYFNAKADLTNIMIFVRCRRMGKDTEFFSYALLPYAGAVKLEKLKEYYNRPVEDFYEMLSSTPYRKVFEDFDFENISVSAMESNITEYLNSLVRKMNSVAFGPQVVVGFLLAKENEISNIRIALSAVASGMDPEKAKEKLRA